MYESTGSPEYLPDTKSVLGILNLETGEIDVKVELDRDIYFGEGSTILGDKIYQLTYKNQKGFVYDASAGVTQGSTLHLWQCHGGDNQKFQIGEEDFGKFEYKVRLQSSNKGSYSNGEFGHTLISTMKIDVNSRFVHHTNTFSFWQPELDGDEVRDDSNEGGRVNNMSKHKNNNQTSNLIVDGFNADWNISLYDEGREVNGFRTARYYITKQGSEELRFMNGYKVDNYNNKSHISPCQTCGTYSIAVWNQYWKYRDSRAHSLSGWGLCPRPANIYDILAPYN